MFIRPLGTGQVLISRIKAEYSLFYFFEFLLLLDVFEDLELLVDFDVFEVLLDLPDLPDFVDLEVLLLLDAVAVVALL